MYERKKKKAHSSFIHSGPKLDINQVSMNRMRDKETVANSHTGILHSNEKTTKTNIDESHSHNVE